MNGHSRERIRKVNENIDALLVAMYIAGPMDGAELTGLVPHPELFEETLRAMEDMGLISGEDP